MPGVDTAASVPGTMVPFCRQRAKTNHPQLGGHLPGRATIAGAFKAGCRRRLNPQPAPAPLPAPARATEGRQPLTSGSVQTHQGEQQHVRSRI